MAKKLSKLEILGDFSFFLLNPQLRGSPLKIVDEYIVGTPLHSPTDVPNN